RVISSSRYAIANLLTVEGRRGYGLRRVAKPDKTVSTPDTFSFDKAASRLALLDCMVGHAARRFFGNRTEIIRPAGGTLRLLLDVFASAEKVGVARDVGIGLFHLQRPNAFGPVDGLQVADARLSLGGFAGLHQVGNGH